MATHDYVIDNQSAPAFRADLNNALLAIASQNSGSSAPGTTYANMLWYDTGANQIKKRNEANSAWIVLGTVDEGAGTFSPSAAITISQIAAATLVTAAETIAANNNDTTIPTSAAVKGYTDTAIAAISITPADASISRAKLKTGTNSASFSTGSGGGSGTILLDAYSFFPAASGSSATITFGGGTVDAPRLAWSAGGSSSGSANWRYVLT